MFGLCLHIENLIVGWIEYLFSSARTLKCKNTGQLKTKTITKAFNYTTFVLVGHYYGGKLMRNYIKTLKLSLPNQIISITHIIIINITIII